jgi:hypothetical protein
MTSDGEMTKTKDVDLEEQYNFIVDNLFIWNHLSEKNSVWISHILKFKIFKRLQMEKRPKSKLQCLMSTTFWLKSFFNLNLWVPNVYFQNLIRWIQKEWWCPLQQLQQTATFPFEVIYTYLLKLRLPAGSVTLTCYYSYNSVLEQ